MVTARDVSAALANTHDLKVRRGHGGSLPWPLRTSQIASSPNNQGIKMEEKHIIVYVDTIPPCDVCGETAYADAKSANGPWGYVCKAHFDQFGCKLGLGLGQELRPVSERGCSCGHPDKFHC